MGNYNTKCTGLLKVITTFIFSICVILCGTCFNYQNVYAETLKKDQNRATSSIESDYTLTLIERGNIKEHINGSDIGMKKDAGITFDENLLRNVVNKLSCLNPDNIIESKNAKLEYIGNQYVIRKEIYGTEIDKEVLYNSIVNAIKVGQTKLDLNSIKCYKDPRYSSTSQEVINAQNTLNRYVSAKISYNYGTDGSVLDGNTIKDWIYINGEYEITILEGKVRQYVDSIADNYRSSLGYSIAVSGGRSGNNHSWSVDRDNETTSLIENIKNGDNITKNPAFVQSSYGDYFANVGDTFVEVDMGRQYLWFYKNGYIVAEGNIVTGNMSASGCATPAGVYTLNRRQKDTVLVGPNYQSPVAFWMPFIGNSIGLHDASWRSEFGGEIYKTSGSHGCVNLPYSLAQSIYNNISVGTPVICFY
ncbi:L,D-transpeptidase family protein [uncultured Clostridium sp.]|uniref:L,D-transpeptidase family protein n=1 Tax=uncultured Clostridium sp. TaxID=59620 RepID=UPI0025D94C93|nr:L,D-transpeptidase family protein [uncultured Clostridium sp.]